jgi:hypothetical protein
MSDSKGFSIDDFGLNLDAGGYSLGLDLDKNDDDAAVVAPPKTTTDAPDKAAGIEGVIATIKPYALPIGVALLLLIGFAAISSRK